MKRLSTAEYQKWHGRITLLAMGIFLACLLADVELIKSLLFALGCFVMMELSLLALGLWTGRYKLDENQHG